MSAFQVSPDHINTMISYIKRNAANHYDKKIYLLPDQVSDFQRFKNITVKNGYTLKEFILFEQDSLDELASILWNENKFSVCYRYKQNFKEESFKFKETQNTIDFFQFLKLCSCLEYQSCEHPDYFKGSAYKVLESLKNRAISFHPDYEAAKWTI